MQNYVYKVHPCDVEQMNDLKISEWISELQVFLNQLPIRPGDQKLSGVLNRKASEEYYYKFYSLENQICFETNNDQVTQIPFCELKSIDQPAQVLMDLDEAYSDTLLESDYVKINGTYFRVVSLYEFPKNLMFSELMNYGDFCLFIKRLDHDLSKRKVNTQRKLHHSNLYSHVRNLESEASFKEAEEISELMMRGEECLFQVEAFFVIKADSEVESTSKTSDLIASLNRIEAKPLIETKGLKKLFLPLFFGVAPTFKRANNPPTSYVSKMIPLLADKLHIGGIELTSKRGNPIYFDLFDESALNFNVLISGQSGSGKSMIAQKILMKQVELGTKAIVLDLGNSFRKTAKYLGGEILSHSFNPMQFKNPIYLKEFILSVIPSNELNSKLEGKIYSIIVEQIEKVSSFKELVLKISSEVPDLEFYFSELWEFFDNDEHSLSHLTYVDTSLYPDKIKAPLIIYLIECFKNLEGRRIFIFDEVWSFLEKNAEYITECFRTFRKYGASAIPISQSLEDFIRTPLGLAIAQNCFTKLYFSQSLTESSFVDKFDLERIKSLSTKKGSHSQFYFKSEIYRKICLYYPSFLEYELFTSNFEDNLAQGKFISENEKYFPFYEVINRFVHFKYFYGGAHA